MSKFKIQFLLLIVLCCYNMLGQETKPNILLITLDDMNWDSPGIFGGTVPNITPNIDHLANTGMRFEKAYVQAPNCSPSRSVIQTGLYPHQSGMRGFYYVQPNGATLPEILKQQGYFTGVLNKLSDTSLSPDFERYWDVSLDFKGAEARSADAYAKQLETFFHKVEESNKPFYCVVNVADPHKPFFNDVESQKSGFDAFQPSHLYALNDVEVPGFLVEHPKIKQEVLNYFNSVKRADDCVGEIVKAIKASGQLKNTVIILFSDHGMPFPFAKSSLYENGLRTPLVISWPGKIASSSVNNDDLVSSIDLAPTILDITQTSIPGSYMGKSFSPILIGKNQKTSNYVFAQFDENAGGVPRPSRTVINGKYGYVFNPWAVGKTPFKSAASYHMTYSVLKQLSESDSIAKKRFKHWVYRTTEELYDYENDPNALHNLINEPEYSSILAELRNTLLTHMTNTNDYVLDAFKNRNDNKFLIEWISSESSQAAGRRTTLKWKRDRNASGATQTNTVLFEIPSN